MESKRILKISIDIAMAAVLFFLMKPATFMMLVSTEKPAWFPATPVSPEI